MTIHQGFVDGKVSLIGSFEYWRHRSTKIDGILLGRVFIEAEQIARLLGVGMSQME